MSLHTPSQWHQSANVNMSNALNTQTSAARQNATSRKAHTDTLNENLAHYNDLHDTFEDKCAASKQLIAKLDARAKSLEASVAQTGHSLAALEAAHRAKEAPLELCHWRMEQREKRPLREQVRDVVELALEEERATLLDTQRQLQAAIKKTQGMVNGLEGKLNEVKEDLYQKSQALNIDELCMRTTHSQWHSEIQRPGRLKTAGLRPSATFANRSTCDPGVDMETQRNEVKRQQQAQYLDNSALNREGAGQAVRDENNKLIAWCQKAANDAAAKTEKALQERISEKQVMKRRLEKEVHNTMLNIDHTKATIVETRKQLTALDEPKALCSTRAAWRQQRAIVEHISDPVTTRLEEHKQSLLRTEGELKDHNQEERSNLLNLESQLERLQQDLAEKTTACGIDQSCLNVNTRTVGQWSKKPMDSMRAERPLRPVKLIPLTPTRTGFL
eukprot:NODE_4893_length_1833_cov_14.919109.p1 GENE.NODE_4893_length_1833_cov_14.919109~~NODE_4893_length_1833_cov_14.919109.p1  ORF type:complete len:445 (-),score=142.19 NODE_4893_length_1833_cov_14.919109:299-1633(-)